MAAPSTLTALLASLTQSLNSTLDATLKLSSTAPPANGVSLLDVKNELLLSYLQNLVFLILLKIRSARDASTSASAEGEGKTDEDLSTVVVEKLVELRLYLEKGVRPLEDKLRFQLDSLLRAADDAKRQAESTEARSKKKQKDTDAVSDGSESNTDSDAESETSQDGGDAQQTDTSHLRPPTLGFIRPQAPLGMSSTTTTTTTTTATSNSADPAAKTGIYRPPKITPTVMPTTDRDVRHPRRPLKSATMDEYITTELSVAPLAEPSVGTNVSSFGRAVKTSAQRAREDHRRDYEETNFVRLPAESKKDRAKRAKAEGRGRKMQFGGEDWRELGEGVDRIGKATGKRRSGDSRGGGTRALLEKSRKRVRDTADIGGRASGLSEGTKVMGERFGRKVRVLEGGRRDRGRR